MADALANLAWTSLLCKTKRLNNQRTIVLMMISNSQSSLKFKHMNGSSGENIGIISHRNSFKYLYLWMKAFTWLAVTTISTQTYTTRCKPSKWKPTWSMRKASSAPSTVVERSIRSEGLTLIWKYSYLDVNTMTLNLINGLIHLCPIVENSTTNCIRKGRKLVAAYLMIIQSMCLGAITGS